MPKRLSSEDILFNVHGMLTIIKDLGLVNKKRVVVAECECGVIREYLLNSLRMGTNKSCGCFRRKFSKEKMTTHGLSSHPLFSIWSGMIQRCYSEYSTEYYNYGDRGVRVCDEWRNDFKSFYDWCMANGWEKGLQIDKDKIGTGLLYSPEMCVILTGEENSWYKRNVINVTLLGETKCLKQWCKIRGLSYKVIHQRIFRDKWSPEDALNPLFDYKGKPRVGALTGCAKLTEEQVIDVFNSKEAGAFFVKKYNVSPMTISQIRTGRSWSYLTGKKFKKRKS